MNVGDTVYFFNPQKEHIFEGRVHRVSKEGHVIVAVDMGDGRRFDHYYSGPYQGEFHKERRLAVNDARKYFQDNIRALKEELKELYKKKWGTK